MQQQTGQDICASYCEEGEDLWFDKNSEPELASGQRQEKRICRIKEILFKRSEGSLYIDSMMAALVALTVPKNPLFAAL